MRIVLVEDSQSLAETYRAYLEPLGAEIQAVETGADMDAALATGDCALLLLDVQLPDADGIEKLQDLRAKGFSVPVIVMTAHGSVGRAVDAMKAGAFDFLMKPFSAERLLTTVRNALSHNELAQEVTALKAAYEKDSFYGLVGTSAPMQAVYRAIEAAAQSKAAVFITGQSGTGKELCAEAIHLASARSERPFVALNCAAMPRDLMESEIFGHKKGAFTGATADRAGAALQADGGTLFLDEIGEMDLELQAKLLRFLQSQTFQRVGDDRTTQVDVRIICATNRDPMDEVRAGRFREDLYYRLYVIPIEMPLLQERGEDVVLLAQSFLDDFAAQEALQAKPLSQEAEMAVRRYEWPGNVRELRNRLHSALVMSPGEEISTGDLKLQGTPEPVSGSSDMPSDTGASINGLQPLWQTEKTAIDAAIARFDGNINRAAAALEISPSTIYRKMERWKKTD